MKHLWVLAGLAISATPMAFAATETVENEVGTVLLEASAGQDFSQFGVGLGIKPENNRPGFGGLYYEQIELVHGIDTDIKLIGFRGFSVEGSAEEPRGADITMGLSQTKRGDYKRTGLSGKATIFMPVTQSMTWFIGGDIRPTFLSIDWENNVLAELGLKVGMDMRLMKNVGVYAQYYHESILSDNLDEERLGNGFVAGLNLVW